MEKIEKGIIAKSYFGLFINLKGRDDLHLKESVIETISENDFDNQVAKSKKIDPDQFEEIIDVRVIYPNGEKADFDFESFKHMIWHK